MMPFKRVPRDTLLTAEGFAVMIPFYNKQII